MEQKVNAAGISIITSSALTVGKLAAGSAMNSASLLAGGIHSGLDLIAAVLSYFSVNQAKKPADEDHRYGHGKYENVSAVAEALLILMAVAVILYKSVAAILHGGAGIRFFELGIAVTGVSALMNFLVSGMLAGAYRRTMSPAFRADRRHLLVNACASAAVCAGIIAVKLTGLTVIDPVLGVMVALILLREGYSHLKQSAGGIVDVCLSGEEEGKIREVLSRHGGRYVQYHALRTRRSGPDCYVDLHLVVPRDQVISLTHEICDAIEKDIRESLPGVNVLIHPEPCRPVSGECGNCSIDKMLRDDELRPADCTARHSQKGGTAG
ncbi:MAG: cation diffusion facilitator family transporter [Bacillota bacterium]